MFLERVERGDPETFEYTGHTDDEDDEDLRVRISGCWRRRRRRRRRPRQSPRAGPRPRPRVTSTAATIHK